MRRESRKNLELLQVVYNSASLGSHEHIMSMFQGFSGGQGQN